MLARHTTIVTALAILSTTCGAPRDASRHICDGSPTTRLALLTIPREDRLPAGSQVMADNGSSYLFVDGACHYWASNPDEPWADVRTGTLDSAAAADLEDVVHYQQWPALAGQWQGDVGYEGDSLVFHDGSFVVACHAYCDTPGVPSEVHQMRDAQSETIRRLWARGTPVEGPVRMMAVAVDPQSTQAAGISTFEWSSSADLGALAMTESAAAAAHVGMGHLLTDSDASALRDLRRAYLRGDHGEFWYRYLPAIDAAGTRYRVYVRDTLPFEGVDGRVPDPMMR